MKWLRTLILFDKGGVALSEDWKTIHTSYLRAISSIEHPVGTGKLTLREKKRAPNGKWQRNGVGYLRTHFLKFMRDAQCWHIEGNVDLARDREQPTILLYPSLTPYIEPITSDFGGFDFISTTANGLRVAIEWETGNISSSHRSMNKLAIALSNNIIDAGILIVPSRKLYQHLTDRIGNIDELSGYLSMWEGLKAVVPYGLLGITVVEHDSLSNDPSLPYLKVGIDGRAKKPTKRHAKRVRPK